MKLVKLNRRHKAYKELGHNWAFRFDSYDYKVCPVIERVFHDMHGGQFAYTHHTPRWKANFGSPTRGSCYRTYWISFFDERDATVVLLQTAN